MTQSRLAVAVVAALLFLSGCGYNKLQGLDEEVKAAWAEVQNQYQRRADLVPNLVETVKGAANFEKDTLTQAPSSRIRFTKSSQRGRPKGGDIQTCKPAHVSAFFCDAFA